MKDKIRSFAAWITPVFIGRFIYKLAFYILRLAVKFTSPQVEIWYRNSILFDNFRPFRSDLDLTILFPETMSIAEIRNILSRIRAFKSTIPFITEQNCYSADEIIDFKSVANPIEVKRDPYLEAHISRRPTREEQFVFLIRMFTYNYADLCRPVPIRVDKWRSYFDLAGLEVNEPITKNSLLRQILALEIEPEKLEDTFGLVCRYLDSESSGWGRGAAFSNPVLCALFPHQLCHHNNFQPGRDLQRLTWAQLNWEAWGLMSQWRHGAIDRPLAENFINHLSVLVSNFPDYPALSKFEITREKLRSCVL